MASRAWSIYVYAVVAITISLAVLWGLANLRARRKRTRGGAVVAASDVPLVCLVNPRSGGGLGGTILRLLADIPEVTAFTLSDDGLLGAIRKLAALQAAGRRPRVVCAGGDGTVTAVARILFQHHLQAVPIACAPLGTGNDCSQSLGMVLPTLTKRGLAGWLNRVRTAPTTGSDLCELFVDTYDDGSIQVVSHKQEVQKAERVIRGTVLNYLSVGLDSRCVYTVELNRQPSRLLNKLTYALAGLANNLAMRPPVTQTLQRLFVNGIEVASDALPSSLASIVCLLIPSYAGGTNIWAFSWQLTRRVYAALFARHLTGSTGTANEGTGNANGTNKGAANGPAAAAPGGSTSAVPLRLHETSDHDIDSDVASKGADPASFCFMRWLHRLRAWRLNTNGGAPSSLWRPQRRDDGRFELVGIRTLWQEGAVVGTQLPCWGGLLRLGQPESICMVFRHPLHTSDADSSSSTSSTTGSSSGSIAAAGDALSPTIPASDRRAFLEDQRRAQGAAVQSGGPYAADQDAADALAWHNNTRTLVHTVSAKGGQPDPLLTTPVPVPASSPATGTGATPTPLQIDGDETTGYQRQQQQQQQQQGGASSGSSAATGGPVGAGAGGGNKLARFSPKAAVMALGRAVKNTAQRLRKGGAGSSANATTGGAAAGSAAVGKKKRQRALLAPPEMEYDEDDCSVASLTSTGTGMPDLARGGAEGLSSGALAGPSSLSEPLGSDGECGSNGAFPVTVTSALEASGSCHSAAGDGVASAHGGAGTSSTATTGGGASTGLPQASTAGMARHIRGYTLAPRGQIASSLDLEGGAEVDIVAASAASSLPSTMVASASASASASVDAVDSISAAAACRTAVIDDDTPASSRTGGAASASGIRNRRLQATEPMGLLGGAQSTPLAGPGTQAASSTDSSHPFSPDASKKVKAGSTGTGAATSRVNELPTVIQGGSLADTEPVFLQIDGEAFKIWGLRRVALRYQGKATMVTFKGTDTGTA